MILSAWFKKRGVGFILMRAGKLSERYGIGPKKSIDRIESCMSALHGYGCYPTFAVPGMVVERNADFIQRLQANGAEIAVHGYNHVDLQAYPPEDSCEQLLHAADVFRAHHLQVNGFRCPYLSVSDNLIEAIPAGAFEYSSNRAVEWPVPPRPGSTNHLMFDTIHKFYDPLKAETTLCIPWTQNGLLEIPTCVPDDLQLHDALGMDNDQISQLWINILHQTHQRGEVFNLMFHPELATFCESPFRKVVEEACQLWPRVWLARLREIAAWWREKANFGIEWEYTEGVFTLETQCTPRATLLCRGFDPGTQMTHWDKDYWRMKPGSIRVMISVLPFIGIAPGGPPWIASTLQAMGYWIDSSETAKQCSIYLDPTRQAQLTNPVDLVAAIECSDAPLIRYWPWPDGARSALCITGDLDALSFMDYAVRLIKR